VQQYTSFSCIWCLHLAIDSVKNTFTSHIDKKNIFNIFVETLSLYIFTIWKSIVYNLFCRDGIYFDKIFHSFSFVDWFCLFIYLWVLTFPLLDCSEFGNFVIILIYKLNLSILKSPTLNDFLTFNLKWIIYWNEI
jgi:hypothetical protein